MSESAFHIAIIGGGLAGLTLSIGLTKHGISHKIYESAPAFADIGAGIAMGPNAVSALTLIDSRLKEKYERCATYNEAVDLKDSWLVFKYGMENGEKIKFGDTIAILNCYSKNENGRSCVHRAKFLEELIKLVPDGVAEFKKTMKDLQQDSEGVIISFSDGTSARSSAVIACDGIKSQSRRIVLGHDDPMISPVFAGEYAYRTLLPRQMVDDILTPELAGNGALYCGYGAYVITYPVDHGRLVNVVAIKRKDDMRWDNDQWLVPCPRETMINDFKDWGEPIRKLVSLIKDSSQWALFDAPHARTYYDGRICLMGDAAHASTPNQGAGASFAFEDAYVLSTLIGAVKSADQIGDVFKAFDHVRRPRTQKLVDTSREAGELYEFLREGIRDDFQKVKKDLESRHIWIWEEDLEKEIELARDFLKTSQ